MRVATGAWIAEAISLADATRDQSPSTRRRFLEERHRSGSVSPQTAHRQMLAAEWLAQTCRRFGLSIGDVKCAWTTAEALARLEAVRPEQASKIMKDALTGTITSRKVLRFASVATSSRSKSSKSPSDWEVYLIEKVGPLLPKGKASIRAAGSDMSDLGRVLLVDVEWITEKNLKYAVFLSPLSGLSRGREIYEVFRCISTARMYYDGVVFISHEDAELEIVAGPNTIRKKPCPLISA